MVHKPCDCNFGAFSLELWSHPEMPFRPFLIPFLLILLVRPSAPTFSPAFRQFLARNYGHAVEKELTREDLGPGGSYGGGMHHAGQLTKHRPLIIVHGSTSNAGSHGSGFAQQFFLKKGYTDEEVYGTTYGDSGKTDILFVTMNCEFARVIRKLIQAVSNYTESKVNVIAYSMGCPIARKAIMGGVCVDTKEDLGPPLTNLVGTFVGVAGPNWGSILCSVPIGACNLVNGLSCGSQYLKDINSKQRYEGDTIYTIYSTGDEWIGYRACGTIVSAIQGQNGTFQREGMTHEGVIRNTADLQFDLVTNGRA